MRRNAKVSAEKVAQSEARAHRIVETLLEPVTDEAEFLNQLRWINPDHYQSITEERAIEKTCGYPLCEGKLVKITSKKYQICTNKNKVYDLTYRKHFCSNQCYKASNYLKQQLLESPLWSREQEEEPKFALLKNSTELMGEEIDFGVEKVSLSKSEIADVKDTEASQATESEAEQSQSKTDVSSNCSTSQNNVEPDQSISFDCTSRCETSTTSCTNSASRGSFYMKYSNSIINPNVNQKNVSNLEKYVKSNSASRHNQSDENLPTSSVSNTAVENSKPNNSKNHESAISSKLLDCSKNRESKTKSPGVPVKRKSTTESSNFVLRVEKSLREWCTVDTFSLVMGAETAKRMMLEKGKISDIKEKAKCDPYFYERYATICKKLKILELEEEKCSNEAKAFEKPTKPLPDFATLQKQAEEMEIKVRAFYRGDKKVTFDQNKNETGENETSVVLPALYQHTRLAIRRNIVLDKLKTILPDLAMMLGFRIIDLSEKIKLLASTCKFEAHNVTFKPLEWNLIGLIFIKLLSLRDTEMQKCFCEKANYVNAMLMSYHLESNYLDLLCTWLMDFDQILKNDEPSPS